MTTIILIAIFIVFIVFGLLQHDLYRKKKDSWEFKFLDTSIRTIYIESELFDNGFNVVGVKDYVKNEINFIGNYCNVPCKINIKYFDSRILELTIKMQAEYNNEFTNIKRAFILKYDGMINFTKEVDGYNLNLVHKNNPISLTFQDVFREIIFKNADIAKLKKEYDIQQIKDNYKI